MVSWAPAANVVCEVAVILNFDHQILISSSSSVSEHLLKMYGNSIETVVGYHIYENGLDVRSKCPWSRNAKI